MLHNLYFHNHGPFNHKVRWAQSIGLAQIVRRSLGIAVIHPDGIYSCCLCLNQSHCLSFSVPFGSKYLSILRNSRGVGLEGMRLTRYCIYLTHLRSFYVHSIHICLQFSHAIKLCWTDLLDYKFELWRCCFPIYSQGPTGRCVLILKLKDNAVTSS